MSKDNSLIEIAGIWEDCEDIREAVEEGRKRSWERSDRIAEKLSEL